MNEKCGDYNIVSKRFSGNLVSPTIANTSENNIKKKVSLKQNRKLALIMLPVAKEKTVESNTELENTSANINKLSCPEESIYTYDTGNVSERKSDFLTDISDNNSSGSDFFP